MATTVSTEKRGFLIPDRPNALLERRIITSTSSMVNGKVDLRKQNPHTFHLSQVRNARASGTWSGTPSLNDASIFYGPPPEVIQRAEQVALAKWRGKLRKGDASLGVSLASWRQSRDMIISRSQKVLPPLTAAERALATLDKASKRGQKIDKRYLNGLARGRASDILEVEFGWLPLFSDIHAALFTVCQEGVPPAWVKGAHTFVHTERRTDTFADVDLIVAGRVTIASTVEITNPNLWLLNRLGLINPATVIWDLIPWSFVVNMFVNVNAILESFTDTVGLNISNQSVTKSYSSMGATKRGISQLERAKGNYGYCENYFRERTRTVGSIPPVQLAVRAPELNWELALIAASLVVQKMTRITRLVRSLTGSDTLKPQLLR